MGDLLDLLERIIQGPIPTYLLWALLIFVVLAALLKSVSFVHSDIIPIFYNAEKSRRRNRRQRFAEHIEHELRRLNSMEEWSDHRFTELEAEVEAEGRRRHPLLPFLIKRDPLRREASLTKALENSTERLILVEGAPGSGKSVALRHVALMMTRRAMRSRNIKTVIPLYVNLKTLRRQTEPECEVCVDAQFIRSFVLQSLNRANDRDVASFLDDEFELGLSDGSWLFLFDSFDEIPEILSSTESDSVVGLYAQAISDFLHGMNNCRGIVASREYRGPKYLTWSKFRIVPLSSRQQQELIEHSELSPEDETKLIGGLFAGLSSSRQFAENPMFLSLLCEYVRVHHAFPEHDFSVYDSYITSRFERDEGRLQQRFGFSIAEVRRSAENIAFCIMEDPTLGLSATRQAIAASLLNHDLALEIDTDQVLDALQFIKIGRIEDDLTSRSQQSFSFAHRRLQESLATMVLIREPERIPPLDLLTNGVWRESTVVLLQQSRSVDVLISLLRAGIKTVHALSQTIPVGDQFNTDEPTPDDPKQLPQPFPWPASLLHVMRLLQDGLVTRPEIVPDILRTLCALVVAKVWNPSKWLVSDMREALAVAGLLPQELLADILSLALRHPSRRIREVAYHQAATLEALQPEHVKAIRSWLVEMAQEGRLQHEYKAIVALIMRVDQSEHLLDVVRFLRAIPYLSLVLGVIVTGLVWLTFLVNDTVVFQLLVSLVLLSPFVINTTAWRAPRKQVVIAFSFIGTSIMLLWLYIRFDKFSPFGIGWIYFYLFLLGYSFALFMWKTGAYYFASNGSFIKPYKWPLALFASVIALLWTTKATATLFIDGAKSVLEEFRDDFRRLLAAFGPIRGLLVLSFFVLVFGAFLWFLLSDTIPRNIQFIVSMLLMLGQVSVMVFVFVSEIRRESIDRKLIRYVSSTKAPLETVDLLRAIGIFQLNESRLRFVRLVRERQLVNDSPDSIRLLTSLVSQLQHDLLNDHNTESHTLPLVTIDVADVFGNWYMSFLKRQSTAKKNRNYGFGLAVFGWEFLDEILLLLEQAKASQRQKA